MALLSAVLCVRNEKERLESTRTRSRAAAHAPGLDARLAEAGI